MTISPIWRAIPTVVLAWVGVLAGVSLASDAAPAQVVILPQPAFFSQLQPGIALVGRSGMTATFASTSPGLARRLYASGAWLVLPGKLRGCTPNRAI